MYNLGLCLIFKAQKVIVNSIFSILGLQRKSNYLQLLYYQINNYYLRQLSLRDINWCLSNIRGVLIALEAKAVRNNEMMDKLLVILYILMNFMRYDTIKSYVIPKRVPLCYNLLLLADSLCLLQRRMIYVFQMEWLK